MVDISIVEFAEMVAKNDKSTDVTALKKALADTLVRKKNGAKCMNCGAPIWAAGSAIVGWDGCFSCISGEADGTDDYEIV